MGDKNDELKYMEGNYSIEDPGMVLAEWWEDTKQAQKLSQEAEYMRKVLEYLKEKEKEHHYLVDGATLTCTRCKLEPDTYYGGTFTAPEGSNESKLKVTHNTSFKNGAGQYFATIRDIEFEPFGNCKNPPDREAERKALMLAAESEELCQYGTCRYLMDLNDEWENWLSNTGYQEVTELNGDSVETITMEAILFCKHGGFIRPIDSGYIKTDNVIEDTEEDREIEIDNPAEVIWEDYELDLLERFGRDLKYENWSDSKKACAQELWKRFYIDGNYDAHFVAGLIGNMYGEANCGQLQYKDWSIYKDSKGNPIGGTKGGTITNIEQARVACLEAPGDYGVGMMQWSHMERKKALYKNYEAVQSEDGTLLEEQMIRAECKTIYEELEGTHAYVCESYQRLRQETDSAGSNITLSTCVLFKQYETPSTHRYVDSDKFAIVEGVWDKAKNADQIGQVPSICQRDVAAKAAYEEFMGMKE